MPDEAKLSRIRFSVSSLLTLQLAIAPLCLAGIFADENRIHTQMNPWLGLIWIVALPVIYVAILVAVKIRRSEPQSTVNFGAGWGILFGLLFGLLAWGPGIFPDLILEINEFCNMLAIRTPRNGFAPLTWRSFWFLTGEMLHGFKHRLVFMIVPYAVFGAASGASVGILAQFLRRAPRSRAV